MRQLVIELADIVSKTMELESPLYDFGSCQSPGQEGWADLRPYFKSLEYVGCDTTEGPGVDRILNLHKIDLPKNSIGTALVLDTLEHVEYPRRAIRELKRVLKPEGAVILVSVMNFLIHEFPEDFWRFTPQAFSSLLKGFKNVFVTSVGVAEFPHTIVGIGFKTKDRKLSDVFLKNIEVWRRVWKICDDNEPRILNRPLKVYEDGTFKLDLGCGPYRREGFLGIDYQPCKNVDMVCDLNRGIPFPDASVSHIYSSHCLEHMQDPFFQLKEMHRVCTDNSQVELIVPIQEPAEGHITIFDEGWFEREISQDMFTITKKEIFTKSGLNIHGQQHSWIQAELLLRKQS